MCLCLCSYIGGVGVGIEEITEGFDRASLVAVNVEGAIAGVFIRTPKSNGEGRTKSGGAWTFLNCPSSGWGGLEEPDEH